MPCRASSSASATRSPSAAIRSTRTASGAKSVDGGQAPGLACIGSPERDSRSGMCLDVARTVVIKSTLPRDGSRRGRRGRPRAGDRGHMASVTSLYSVHDRPCVALAAGCRLGAAPLQCHTRPVTYGGTVVAPVHRRLTRADSSISAGIPEEVTLYRMGGGIMKHLNLEVEKLEERLATWLPPITLPPIGGGGSGTGSHGSGSCGCSCS